MNYLDVFRIYSDEENIDDMLELEYENITSRIRYTDIDDMLNTDDLVY